ncbi:hypothetical protein J6590_070451 [Homalodisca vitripennis]|nr:hypothetical protein J6590_070451 [Homalodisca vitripennis]
MSPHRIQKHKPITPELTNYMKFTLERMEPSDFTAQDPRAETYYTRTNELYEEPRAETHYTRTNELYEVHTGENGPNSHWREWTQAISPHRIQEQKLIPPEVMNCMKFTLERMDPSDVTAQDPRAQTYYTRTNELYEVHTGENGPKPCHRTGSKSTNLLHQN